MILENYEIVEVYREINGWECGRAIDKRSNRIVRLSRFTYDAATSQETVQEYVGCLNWLRENPHPNLKSVYDSGLENGQIVIVSEWVDSENLHDRKDRGLTFDDVVAMSRALTTALQHLHVQGFVHRAINPECVFFENATHAVRLGVPLWKFSEQHTSAEEDHVFFAPEVLTSQEYSVASDIYAVGILLYSTLVGSFPWVNQNGRIRARAEEDAVPRLPTSLSAFQPLIDDMLAFDPNLRRLSDEALLELGHEIDTVSSLAHDVRYRSGLVNSEEVERVAQPLDQSPSSPIENSIKRSRVWLYSSVVAITVVGVITALYAYTNFDSVRMVLYEIGIVDHPELSERWRQAQSLRMDQNQSLITLIAAYNRVLKLEPNHSGALRAIAEEKEERRGKIETLIKSDEFSLAQARLDEYVTAVPNDLEIANLVTELENRQRRDRLLDDARDLVAAGIEDLVLLDTAVRAYQTVLSVYPDSDEARRQLNDIAVLYIEAALNAASEEDIDRAWNFFEKAEEADPDVQELENVRGTIKLAESLENEIKSTIQRATTLFDGGQLITPPGEDNAMSTYRQVLALDPGNELAMAKLKEIEQRLIEMHLGLLEEREFGAEANLLSAARQAGVSPDTLQSMVDAYENLQADIDSAKKLYRKAQSLFERGYVSAPANDNAIDVLKEAQTLDAKNTDVNALLDQCAERTAAVAIEAYEAGLTDQAIQYMSIARDIQPMNDFWSSKYREWSQLD